MLYRFTIFFLRQILSHSETILQASLFSIGFLSEALKSLTYLINGQPAAHAQGDDSTLNGRQQRAEQFGKRSGGCGTQ